MLSQDQTDTLVASVAQQISLDIFDPSDHELLSQLVECLGDTRGMMRLRVAEILGGIGEPAVPFLLKGLSDYDNPVVRRAAAKTLTLIADPSTVPNLLKALLTDEDTVVKGSSVGALASIGEPAVHALLNILSSSESPESIKGHAAWALAFIGAEAKELVFKEIASDSPTVRAAVIGVISKVAQESSDDAAFGLLVQALEDNDSNVRSEAAAALGSAAYQPAISSLLKLLQHSEIDTRKSAILALMKIENPLTLEDLRLSAKNDPEEVLIPIYKLAISRLEHVYPSFIS